MLIEKSRQTPLQDYFKYHAGPSTSPHDIDEKASEKLNIAIRECSFRMRNAETITKKLDELRKLAATPCGDEEAPLKMRSILKFSKRYLPPADWKIYSANIIINAADEAFGQTRLWY